MRSTIIAFLSAFLIGLMILSARAQQGNDQSGTVGVQCAALSDGSGFRITNVFAGSAAARAGLQVGDIIRAIGQTPARDIYLYEVYHLLHGPPNSTVVLTIERGSGTPPLSVAVTRAPVEVQESVSAGPADPTVTNAPVVGAPVSAAPAARSAGTSTEKTALIHDMTDNYQVLQAVVTDRLIDIRMSPAWWESSSTNETVRLIALCLGQLAINLGMQDPHYEYNGPEQVPADMARLTPIVDGWGSRVRATLILDIPVDRHDVFSVCQTIDSMMYAIADKKTFLPRSGRCILTIAINPDPKTRAVTLDMSPDATEFKFLVPQRGRDEFDTPSPSRLLQRGNSKEMAAKWEKDNRPHDQYEDKPPGWMDLYIIAPGQEFGRSGGGIELYPGMAGVFHVYGARKDEKYVCVDSQVTWSADEEHLHILSQGSQGCRVQALNPGEGTLRAALRGDPKSLSVQVFQVHQPKHDK